MAWRSANTQRAATPMRTYILPPEKTSFDVLATGAPPAISPDGQRIVVGIAEPGKKRLLYLRDLNSLAMQPLAGTEDAMFPFWSPDGRFVAFFADSALKKMEVSGGAPVIVCSVTDGRGGSWSPDGRTIVFGGRYTPIQRVAASGGTPVDVTQLGRNEATHRFPEFLPDSRHFLYLGSITGNEDPSNTIYVGSIDGRESKALISGADEPHYLNGSIIFVRDHILTAQRFDLDKLAVLGDAVPLKEQHIESTMLFSRSIVTVGRSGTLVYEIGLAATNSRLNWFDRSGKVLGTVGEDAPYASVALSPDQNSVGLRINASPANLWNIDLVRGVKTRATFGNTQDYGPIWSPDGRRMLYSSMLGRTFALYVKDLTTGREEELLRGDVASGTLVPTSWSPDGDKILYNSGGLRTRGDIFWMSLSERKPRPYLATPFIEASGRFSPDGHWIAYSSTESTRAEIYLAPFPATGAKWQVSSTGGVTPRWRQDGKELYYVSPGVPGAMWAAPITLGSAPQIGKAVKLFDFVIAQPSPSLYDVSNDGKRFVVNTRIGETPPPSPLIVVQHFDNELRDALEHRE
jgi:Tol biopolymer transport system component